MNEKDYAINEITLGGVIKPTITIRGLKKRNIIFFAQIDNEIYNFVEQVEIGRDFVIDLVKKEDSLKKFVMSVIITNKAKKIDIFIMNGDEKLKIKSMKTNVFMRIVDKIFYEIRIVPTRIKRLGHILVKVFKTLKKHHFFISPKLFKRYLSSVRNNMGVNNVEDFFYNPLEQSDYLKWLSENNSNIKINKLQYNPLISVIVPVYNVDKLYLEECIESVLKQTYQNFELILVDDCSTKAETKECLKKYEKNEKISVIYRRKNGHISASTNTGIDNAKGEFISLLDNDDVLDKNALYYTVLELNRDKKIDMLYSDEDKIYYDGNLYFPHFKPDFSPDTLLSSNYICHFTTLRKSIVKKIGGFRSEYNGSQDYDLFLRFSEQTNKIYHIPKVLYHWRMIPSSTASSADSKNYAYTAGKNALEDALKRRKIDAKVHLIGTPQMYDIEYLYEKEPKISIVIPTNERADLLEMCLNSIYNKTTYKNYEILVVNNNSEKEETFKLLDEYKKTKDNFDYITLNCEFNYSFINNEAVKKTNGKYIVLLNNDIEIISSNWLSKMVGYAMQPHIGCVGIKLLYPSLTIQHAGVIIGGGGIASHAFIGTGDDSYGYFGRLIATYNYSAVTAACLMIDKKKYWEVKGLDEKLKVAYNDVDLNLKILEKGYYNVFLPSIKAIHYESITRGNDLSIENKERYISEIKYMANKWGEKVLFDKFYNNNLSYYYPFHLDKKENINDEKKL